MAKRGHTGHAYRTIWNALLVKPDFIICWLCGEFIDQRLRYPHPMSKSLDMVVPFIKGGDPADPNNYMPAHFAHNSGRRDRSPEEYRKYLRGKANGCNSRRGAGKTDKAPARRWTTTDQP